MDARGGSVSIMMYLQETTVWDTEYPMPNHIYILERNKCIGYILAGTKKKIMFDKPMFFDKRGRTFKQVRL